MSQASLSRSEPDYFTYYTRQLEDLLLGDEDFMPSGPRTGGICGEVRGKEKIEYSSDGSSLSTYVGPNLSDSKKERLNTLLWQAVADLSKQVDERFYPVVRMCRLQSELRNKKHISERTAGVVDNEAKIPNKKLKLSSASSKCLDGAALGGGMSNVVQNHCSSCSTKSSCQWIIDAEGKLLCYACGFGGIDESESHLGSITCADQGLEESEDDFKFLLENDSSLVEEIMKKHSDDLLASLGHMETQLEKLLDTLVSSCRPMSIAEKQQLQNRIGKLAPKNFERIASIVQRNRQGQMQCDDEIMVDLLQEDNITLQRLRFYAEAIERARKLSHKVSN